MKSEPEPRKLDKEAAAGWLQQAECELKAVETLLAHALYSPTVIRPWLVKSLRVDVKNCAASGGNLRFRALSHLLPAATEVFHAQQVVELALKSAMLRTCGLVTEEFTGSTSHDLVGFYVRLVSATPATDAQKDAMEATRLC